MVKQHNESKESIRSLLDNEGLPISLVQLIEEFMVDPELETLLLSRQSLSKSGKDNEDNASNAQTSKMENRKSSLKPFQIFELYSTEGAN